MPDKIQNLIECADVLIEEYEKLGEYHEVPTSICHAIDDLITALNAASKVNNSPWQPIETIPKDGSEVLTIRPNGYIAKGVYYDNPFGRKDTVIENSSGKWWSVTHWMPLPPMPNPGPAFN